MKRLIKKIAWEKIECYHATSSQALKKIKESGYIEPSSYTGITSNGLGDYDDNSKYLEEKFKSGNDNGVYLGTEEILNYYRKNAVDATVFDNITPNIPVDLKLSVTSDALSPDYDDLSAIGEDVNNVTWEDSMDEIGQVVHNGPISIEEISSIRFTKEDILLGDIPFEHDEKIMSIVDKNIQFNNWINLNTALSQLQKLEEEIHEFTQKENIMVAFKTTRLKKTTA